MRFSRLGSTSLQVSTLGFGASTLGEEFGALDYVEGSRAVHCAIDHGINLFDVSPYYGRTLAEERLGKALKDKRDRVVLSTKAGRYDQELPDGFDFSAKRVARSLEESLRRLRTDVIDLFLAHDIEFASREQILQETLPAMRKLKEEGKVRFIGVTGFPPGLLREVALEGEVDVVLSYCHYNLLNTRVEADLVPLLRERGVGLINGSPLHMGVLTPQGPPAWHPAPPEVIQAARATLAWCVRRGVDLSDLALRFALDNRAIASTLVGMRTEAEVRANLQALDAGPDPELLAGVRRLLEKVQDIEWTSGLPENNPPPAISV
jgi:L-galactose dehydrogenase